MSLCISHLSAAHRRHLGNLLQTLKRQMLDGIPSDRMRQLVFDKVGTNLQHFVKYGSRHGPETMAGHFVLFKTHAPKG